MSTKPTTAPGLGVPLTVPQLAARWQCSPQHVHNMIRRGELSAIRLGRLVRVPWEEIERCESSSTEAKPKEGGPAESLSKPPTVISLSGRSVISR